MMLVINLFVMSVFTRHGQHGLAACCHGDQLFLCILSAGEERQEIRLRRTSTVPGFFHLHHRPQQTVCCLCFHLRDVMSPTFGPADITDGCDWLIRLSELQHKNVGLLSDFLCHCLRLCSVSVFLSSVHFAV